MALTSRLWPCLAYSPRVGLACAHWGQAPPGSRWSSSPSCWAVGSSDRLSGSSWARRPCSPRQSSLPGSDRGCPTKCWLQPSSGWGPVCCPAGCAAGQRHWCWPSTGPLRHFSTAGSWISRSGRSIWAWIPSCPSTRRPPSARTCGTSSCSMLRRRWVGTWGGP